MASADSVDSGKDELEFHLHTKALAVAKNVAIGILPVAYVLGYYAWSKHNLDYGLGWVSAPPERYLALGLTALFLGASVGIFVVGARMLSWAMRKWKMPYRSLALAAYPLCGALAFSLYFSFLGVIDVVDGRSLHWYSPPIVGAFTVSFAGGLWFFAERPPAWTGSKTERPRKGAIVVTTPLLISAALGGLIFPLFFMDAVQSDFGGTTPSLAIFEIRQEDVTPALRVGLLDGWNATHPVEETRLLWVLSSSADSYLVRDAEGNPHDGVLIQIPASKVAAIRWVFH